MRIPGIPGASEPSFRTRDRVWIALDDLVYETCSKLEEEGVLLSPYSCKAAIQVSRQLMLEFTGFRRGAGCGGLAAPAEERGAPPCFTHR